MWLTLAIGSISTLAVYIVALTLIKFASPRPTLGHADGKLSPTVPSPNNVSSQGHDPEHTVDPLAYTGDPHTALTSLLAEVGALSRVSLITQDRTYAHFECRTLLMRFTDDLEFLLDEAAGVIHVRSASRLGYSDLGVNRRRVESIRTHLRQRLPSIFA